VPQPPVPPMTPQIQGERYGGAYWDPATFHLVAEADTSTWSF